MRCNRVRTTPRNGRSNGIRKNVGKTRWWAGRQRKCFKRICTEWQYIIFSGPILIHPWWSTSVPKKMRLSTVNGWVCSILFLIDRSISSRFQVINMKSSSHPPIKPSRKSTERIILGTKRHVYQPNRHEHDECSLSLFSPSALIVNNKLLILSFTSKNMHPIYNLHSCFIPLTQTLRIDPTVSVELRSIATDGKLSVNSWECASRETGRGTTDTAQSLFIFQFVFAGDNTCQTSFLFTSRFCPDAKHSATARGSGRVFPSGHWCDNDEKVRYSLQHFDWKSDGLILFSYDISDGQLEVLFK